MKRQQRLRDHRAGPLMTCVSRCSPQCNYLLLPLIQSQGPPWSSFPPPPASLLPNVGHGWKKQDVSHVLCLSSSPAAYLGRQTRADVKLKPPDESKCVCFFYSSFQFKVTLNIPLTQSCCLHSAMLLVSFVSGRLKTHQSTQS